MARSRRLTHGKTGSTEFTVWRNMRRRCSDPKDPAYPDYGGRGITVCERWQKFENFLADMGPRPDGMSIDRINVDGNYEPSNCRWASCQDQNNNRRSNALVHWRGRDCTLAQVARESGVSYPKLRARIQKLGWAVERATQDGVPA